MKTKPPAVKRVNDRIPIPGGGACPRCADHAPMQRYGRPPSYAPSAGAVPFAHVLRWDRCSICNFIQRLEPADGGRP